MKIIGLTGGIATGKSAVSRHLASLGARVWDADAVARAVVEPGGPAYAGVKLAFGQAYFLPDGHLDRQKLARLVFTDDEAREKLNRIIHPTVYQNMHETLNRWREEGVAVAVMDIPLLFESGAEGYMDEIWTLSSGIDLQLERLKARGMTQAEAQARIDSQMSDAERRRRSSRVIDTSCALEDTLRSVTTLYEELLED